MDTKSAGPFKEQTTVPDGVYDGVWGGYRVQMLVDGRKIEFETDAGVRGINNPVVVTVKDGAATVKTKK